jgi:hypothetical protein
MSARPSHGSTAGAIPPETAPKRSSTGPFRYPGPRDLEAPHARPGLDVAPSDVAHPEAQNVAQNGTFGARPRKNKRNLAEGMGLISNLLYL